MFENIGIVLMFYFLNILKPFNYFKSYLICHYS